MAKTYVVTKTIFKPKRDGILFMHGSYISKEDAIKHPENVKLVPTKYPVSEHSFEFEEAEKAEQKEVLDELYNRKPKNKKSKKVEKKDN
jgi:hypothetical protein